MDIFTRVNLARTLVMSLPNHIYRVYCPDSKMIEKLWKTHQSCIWMRSFENKVSCRVKIARNRLSLPVQNGGLGILHTKTTVALSAISALFSILTHIIKDPESILAPIFQSNPEKYNVALRFFNLHHFNTFFSLN